VRRPPARRQFEAELPTFPPGDLEVELGAAGADQRWRMGARREVDARAVVFDAPGPGPIEEVSPEPVGVASGAARWLVGVCGSHAVGSLR
jgi:hypothetical protein